MSQFGYLKFGVAVPFIGLANPYKNVKIISNLAKRASKKGICFLAFPQLSVVGCTCFDLLFNDDLVNETQKAVKWLVNDLKNFNICCVVGVCVRVGGKLFNCAAVIFKGRIWGLVVDDSISKTSANERWFFNVSELGCEKVSFCDSQIPVGANLNFKVDDAVVRIQFGLNSNCGCVGALNGGANLICCLTNCEFNSTSFEQQIILAKALSLNSNCAVMAVNPGLGESSANSVYVGFGLFVEDGKLIKVKKQFNFSSLTLACDVDVTRRGRFAQNMSGSCVNLNYINLNLVSENFEISRLIEKVPFIEKGCVSCLNVFKAQVLALARRVLHLKPNKMVIGISGGLDSTLALLVAVEVCKMLDKSPSFVLGVFMPGFGTSVQAKQNAMDLAKLLKISFRCVSIKNACRQHFSDIGCKENEFDVTFENAQARERLQILFDLANKVGGLVVGTTDLSEIALGFSTYAGDGMAHYGVNCGVCKTVVKKIIAIIAANSEDALKKVLVNVIKMPISPELVNIYKFKDKISQKTEDILGPYLLHDFFLFYFVGFGFSLSKIKFLAYHAFKGLYSKNKIDTTLKIFVRRFILQQFKRASTPDGVKTALFSLSSSKDWQMAADCLVDFFDSLC